MAVEPQLVPADSGGAAASCGPLELEYLRKVPLFQTLSDHAARELCRRITVREYKAPVRLFNAGDTGDAMYLIESGRVRITLTDADGHEVRLTELQEGEFFGEMVLIDGHERSAGATVLEDSRLGILTRKDFLSFITQDNQVMLTMLVEMAGRLRRTDNILRHRVARNANTEEAAQSTAAERAADVIANFGGSWKFIGLSFFFLLLWIAANTWMLKSRIFDPYPYVFLNLVLAMMTGLQAPFIMMSQNRQSQKDRLRADLDYEVNLKNELLLTEIRRLIQEQLRIRRQSDVHSSAID